MKAKRLTALALAALMAAPDYERSTGAGHRKGPGHGLLR